MPEKPQLTFRIGLGWRHASHLPDILFLGRSYPMAELAVVGVVPATDVLGLVVEGELVAGRVSALNECFY